MQKLFPHQRFAHQDEAPTPSCALPVNAAGGEKRGMLWVAGSFLICPCHLPLTLGLLGTVLGGTAAGALLRQYPVAAGLVVTVAWALGTLRGVKHLRNANHYAARITRANI
jgi:MerE protein